MEGGRKAWRSESMRQVPPEMFTKKGITEAKGMASIRRLSKCLRGLEAGEKEEIMGKLAGKVAVVTGASKGIGAGIAKALGAEGASVVVNYASSKEGAEAVVAAITAAGGK